MDHSEIKRRLAEAQANEQGKRMKGDHKAWKTALEQTLAVERELAAAEGHPYAVSIKEIPQWDKGAPFPILLTNDYTALLTFQLSDAGPDWSTKGWPMALIEFKGYEAVKLGSPNDEVAEGHPLHGRGAAPYAAQIVMNSPWLKELEQINSIHRNYQPEVWKTLNHYIFWFHDSTFECVAETYQLELYQEKNMTVMLDRMRERLLR